MVAILRANKATTTKNSSTKPTMKMRLLIEDLNDPNAPKDALLILNTRDQIFQLLAKRKPSVALRSPNVKNLHLSAQAAPTSLNAASQMLRELSAPSLMSLVLIDLISLIFLTVSLMTLAVLKAPLALSSQLAPLANSPPKLDLPSHVPDLASLVPLLVTNDPTNLSAHSLKVDVLRSQAAPISLIVP